MNQNYLRGMQCPACKSEGPFLVEVTTQMVLSDEGLREHHGGRHWNAESYMRCIQCDLGSMAAEFYIGNQNEET